MTNVASKMSLQGSKHTKKLQNSFQLNKVKLIFFSMNQQEYVPRTLLPYDPA